MDEVCKRLPCCLLHICPFQHNSSIMASAHIVTFIFRIWRPTFVVCFATNVLNVMRALRITISSSIFCTCLIVPLAFLPCFVHLNKVHCTVHATHRMRHIEGHGKLAVFQKEHFVVLSILIQHVQA